MDEPEDQKIEESDENSREEGDEESREDNTEENREDTGGENPESESSKRLARRIKESLAGAGITLENLGELTALCGNAASRAVKVVAVPLGLREGIDELNTTPRDRVVMVRVDKDTSEALDSWVQTGALKSRSEAAALFMNEGLKIRSGELGQLKEGLEEVEEAKRKLHERAREVLGSVADSELGRQAADELNEDGSGEGADNEAVN
jgi:hypothetical protein